MQNFFDILPEPAPTAVALGYFDGIHMGHKNVLSRAAYEKKNGLVSVCFTFSESPKSVLRGTQSEALMTNKEKLKMLDKLGIDHTYQADFKSIMNMSAQDFAEKILVNTLGAKKLFCGFNYRYGKNGEGDVKVLGDFCGKNGIKLTVVQPTEIDG